MNSFSRSNDFIYHPGVTGSSLSATTATVVSDECEESSCGSCSKPTLSSTDINHNQLLPYSVESNFQVINNSAAVNSSNNNGRLDLSFTKCNFPADYLPYASGARQSAHSHSHEHQQQQQQHQQQHHQHHQHHHIDIKPRTDHNVHSSHSQIMNGSNNKNGCCDGGGGGGGYDNKSYQNSEPTSNADTHQVLVDRQQQSDPHSSSSTQQLPTPLFSSAVNAILYSRTANPYSNNTQPTLSPDLMGSCPSQYAVNTSNFFASSATSATTQSSSTMINGDACQQTESQMRTNYGATHQRSRGKSREKSTLQSIQCCLTFTMFGTILAVLSLVVGFSFYLAIVTNFWSRPPSIYAISGTFKVSSGDQFTMRLLNQTSIEFLNKSARYESLMDRVLEQSTIGESVLSTEVHTFRSGSLTVFFRIYTIKPRLDGLLELQSKAVINLGSIENVFIDENTLLARLTSVLRSTFRQLRAQLRVTSPDIFVDSDSVRVNRVDLISRDSYRDRLRKKWADRRTMQALNKQLNKNSSSSNARKNRFEAANLLLGNDEDEITGNGIDESFESSEDGKVREDTANNDQLDNSENNRTTTSDNSDESKVHVIETSEDDDVVVSGVADNSPNSSLSSNVAAEFEETVDDREATLSETTTITSNWRLSEMTEEPLTTTTPTTQTPTTPTTIHHNDNDDGTVLGNNEYEVDDADASDVDSGGDKHNKTNTAHIDDVVDGHMGATDATTITAATDPPKSPVLAEHDKANASINHSVGNREDKDNAMVNTTTTNYNEEMATILTTTNTPTTDNVDSSDTGVETPCLDTNNCHLSHRESKKLNITSITANEEDVETTTIAIATTVTTQNTSLLVKEDDDVHEDSADDDVELHSLSKCTDEEFECTSSGECIPLDDVCNQILDCSDKSDEFNCKCVDYLYREENHRHKICDGVIDCQDQSDERNCPKCGRDSFVCTGKQNQCIASSRVCDGEEDCPNGDDEHGCISLAESATSSLLTAPSSSSHKLGVTYNQRGILLIRQHGQWAPLCFDSYESQLNELHPNRTASPLGIEDMGQAVCRANSFDTLKSIDIETLSPEWSSQRVFYSINTTLASNKDNAHRQPSSAMWSSLFEPAVCPDRKVARIECTNFECGIRPVIPTHRRRIVGGQSSSFGSWPWQAALYREGEFQCGAVIIDNEWVLTAAHCFHTSKDAYWTVRAGLLRRGSLLQSYHEELRRIDQIVIHPDYVDKGFLNDIALLRLDRPLQFSKFIRTICLPDSDDVVERWHSQLCTTVGWGKLYEHGRIFPDTLQEVRLPIISSDECRKRTLFLPLYKITENMFCAGYERGGRDACLGDSGGPMMCQREDGKWLLLGITSNGDGCGRAGRPGVYTKVSNYLNWIANVTSAHWKSIEPAPCVGHRCPLGKCLRREQVCDQVINCEDSSDELHCH